MSKTTERYVKVPVEFHETTFSNRDTRKVTAELRCACFIAASVATSRKFLVGRGSTTDEAFADLLRQLGYEEANCVVPSETPQCEPLIAEKTSVEEDAAIGAVWLPGEVESIQNSDYWYYVGVKTTRGTIMFPVTYEHAKSIHVGEEYFISMRRCV